MDSFNSLFSEISESVLASKNLEADLSNKYVLILCTNGGIKRGFDSFLTNLLNIKEAVIYTPSEELPTPEGVCLFLQNQHRIPDIILAIGGGSVIDFAKIISWAMPHSDNIAAEQLVDSVKRATFSIPLIVCPTTIGTGSEVTPFATIWDMKRKVKLSVSSHLQVPTSIVYCRSFYSFLPNRVAVFSVLDSLTQCLESIWNKNCTDESYRHAILGLKLIFKNISNISHTYLPLNNYFFINDMIEAAFRSGQAIAKTRTSICHSISYPLTAHYGVPHGLGCFAFLPHFLKIALKLDLFFLNKLCADLNQTPSNLLKMICRLHHTLEVNNILLSFCRKEEIFEVVPEMFTPGRSDTFVVNLTEEDLRIAIKYTLETDQICN